MKRKILVLIMAVCLLSSMKVEAKVLSDEITKLSKTDNINFATDDPDNNVRYIGSNPNNYVEFNNELWRIIGVFDGKIKIIRMNSIGSYSFDLIGDSYDNATGQNDYSKSKLMQELNGDYLNYNLTSNTSWYQRIPNRITGEFDYKKVIKKDAQDMITESVWHLNVPNVVNGVVIVDKSLLTAKTVYNNEYHSSSDKTWTGKVGLINTSDYLYQTAGSTAVSRDECLNTGYWRQLVDCTNNSWFKASWIWAINQYEYSDNSWASSPAHAVEGNEVTASQSVYPVVFLNSHVYSTDGDGSKKNPYKVSLYHEVEFINDDNSEIVKVENNTKVEYKELTKENYTFLGWYEDTELTKKYDFNNLVSAPKKLYAKWISNKVENVDNNKVKEVTMNPKTGDSAIIAIILLFISSASLYLVNKNKNKK